MGTLRQIAAKMGIPPDAPYDEYKAATVAAIAAGRIRFSVKRTGHELPVPRNKAEAIRIFTIYEACQRPPSAADQVPTADELDTAADRYSDSIQKGFSNMRSTLEDSAVQPRDI